MTAETVAEFTLWPSFTAADSFEGDSAAAAAAASPLGGGSFNALRANDVSPFSGMSDQSPQLGFDYAGTAGNDLFHSTEAANTAELFALLQQQQQQQPPNSTDEQCIDAEISRLLQMKQALHRQRQQPHVQGSAQHTAAPILEDEPFVQQSQASLTMQPMGSVSSSASVMPPVSLSLDQSLQMDCLLTPAQSAALDISQDWAWASGTAAAAAAARQPMRHSIDLGGLAQRMAAFDIGSSNSFTPAQHSCSFSTTTQQQLAVSNAFTAQQSMAAAAAAAAASAAAAAAALTAATGPFCAGGLTATSGLPPPGASLAGNQLAANQFAGNQLAASQLAGNQLTLQSALYAPVSTSSRVSMEQPLPHIPQTATAYGLRPGSVNRIPTGRLSLDVTACSSLYSSTAAPMGVSAGVQQMGLTSAQAAWLSNAAAANRAVSSINTSQRASIDIPLSRTPDGRCPPRKTASVVSTGSARDSPTHAAGRKSATFSAEDRPGGVGAAARNGGRAGPVHQAPKWAGLHWHPMADVVKSGQIANKGTGVFIPGGVKASAS